jgi:hypothetical protein
MFASVVTATTCGTVDDRSGASSFSGLGPTVLTGGHEAQVWTVQLHQVTRAGPLG